ncbi:unnamed protein product [Closterium sp. NIES-53]
MFVGGVAVKCCCSCLIFWRGEAAAVVGIGLCNVAALVLNPLLQVPGERPMCAFSELADGGRCRPILHHAPPDPQHGGVSPCSNPLHVWGEISPVRRGGQEVVKPHSVVHGVRPVLLWEAGLVHEGAYLRHESAVDLLCDALLLVSVGDVTRSQWLTRDAAARLAIRNHLLLAKCAHFGQHRTAQVDAVVARYSSPITAALGCLLLPYLFPELSTFATVGDLVSHLRASDSRYRAAAPAEFLDKNQPPMFITLYFIVTRLPDSLRSVKDHFLSLDPTSPTFDLLEQHLLAAKTGGVGAARGTPRPPFFEGCSPSPLAPSYTSAAAANVYVAEDVGAASASAKCSSSKGKGARGGGGGSGGGGGGSGSSGGGSSGGGGGGGTVGGSGGYVGGGGGSGGSGGSGGGGTGGGGTGARRGVSGGGQRQVAIFDLDFDAILSAMYALSISAEGDCYQCVPPHPGIAAAALGASDSGTLPGTAPAEALHTFTLDSGASRCFCRDSTTLTPLPAPVPIRLANPSGGPVVARSSTVLPCPAVLTGSLSGLHLPSFSTNLVTTAALQDAMTLLWHHRLGHPSLPRLHCMHSRLLVFGLPRSLPPLPRSPSLPCLPCVEGRQRAAPHSSSFLSTTALMQTLHMDVWGPARITGQGRERYFLLVVDDNTRYTTVFPMRSKCQRSGGLTERREPKSCPVSPVRTASRVPRSCPPPVPGTHAMTLPPSCFPLRVPLPAPPEPSLPEAPDPESDRACAASPTVSHFLATAFSDPSFESAAASALVAELLDFAATCRLDYASALVAESASASPPSIGGECALGMDVLEDRQEDFECPAAAVPRFASMLLAPDGDPDAPDIPTPRSYAEAITALLRVALSGLQHSFPAGQPAQGDLAAPPTWLHWVVSYRYPVEPPPASLRSSPGASRVARHTLRTTLAALGIAPSTADPSLFLRNDTSLPSFYLVYIDELVFATADTEALTLVLQRFGFQFSSPQPTPLSIGHSLSAPPSDESVEPSDPYLELVGCLMYLMTCTRPDLAYPLSLLTRYVAPGRHRKVHWDAAKRVLRYLCSTLGMGLVLGGRGTVVLTGHADASWELCWLTYLLTDLGEQPRSPPVLYVDNKAMIGLCQEHRLEHIALRYFLAGELEQRGQLGLAYVANTADIFTKALPPGDHQCFATVLGLVPTLPHLLTA